jgi:succinate-semialdehyde dehydrogenase/glutarate-semialdehyde dehydrogenase
VKEFTEKLIARVSKLKVGSGLDPSTTQGLLVNAAAVKKIHEHITDALSKGAKVEFGGIPEDHSTDKGFYCPPTVLSGVTAAMVVANDESFGPLAPIFEFDTEEEVLRLANDTEFGLAGYFFTRDIGKAHRVAQRLQVVWLA